MKDHSGTLEEVRAAIFASKEAHRRNDAQASIEAKFAMLESMQELAIEMTHARATLQSQAAPQNPKSK